MAAFNVVRMRVKPEHEEAFLAMNREPRAEPMPGMRAASVIKTGERSYCFIGEWQDMAAIVAARPLMIGELDRMRPMLESLGDELGLTDPVSGEVVVELVKRREAWSG